MFVTYFRPKRCTQFRWITYHWFITLLFCTLVKPVMTPRFKRDVTLLSNRCITKPEQCNGVNVNILFYNASHSRRIANARTSDSHAGKLYAFCLSCHLSIISDIQIFKFIKYLPIWNFLKPMWNKTYLSRIDGYPLMLGLLISNRLDVKAELTDQRLWSHISEEITVISFISLSSRTHGHFIDTPAISKWSIGGNRPCPED